MFIQPVAFSIISSCDIGHIIYNGGWGKRCALLALYQFSQVYPRKQIDKIVFRMCDLFFILNPW